MLAKKYKLTRKDISFIYKKQKFIPGRYFLFLYWYQYPNRKFNQFSIQIPLKLTKSSVKRNFLKRIIYDYLREGNFFLQKINGGYYKIFIFLNKSKISQIQKLLEKKDKNFIKKHIIYYFDQDFKKVINFLSNDKKDLG